jgi:hypothetical protein
MPVIRTIHLRFLASNASLFIFTVKEASQVNHWAGFAERDPSMLRYRHSP